MGSALEMAVVGVVVAGALVWAARSSWRSVKKQGVCSSCGSSGDCPVAKKGAAPDGAACGDPAGPGAPEDGGDNPGPPSS